MNDVLAAEGCVDNATIIATINNGKNSKAATEAGYIVNNNMPRQLYTRKIVTAIDLFRVYVPYYPLSIRYPHKSVLHYSPLPSMGEGLRVRVVNFVSPSYSFVCRSFTVRFASFFTLVGARHAVPSSLVFPGENRHLTKENICASIMSLCVK